MKRWTTAAVALAGLAVIPLTSLPASAATANYKGFRPQSAQSASEECRDLAAINTERQAAGVPPLRGLQSKLTHYARIHARDMASQGTLWHDMSAEMAAAPAGWYTLGENVAFAGTIDQVHQLYMGSPGHRANILSANYNYVGIGVWHAGGYVYNSEDFIGSANPSLAVLTC